MTNMELGNKLVEFCRENKNLDFINTYYAENITSVEAADSPETDMPREMTGLEAITQKNKWWYDNHEVLSKTVTGPFAHGTDRFAVFFDFETSFKATGEKMQMQEIAVYTTENGKITREEFFYTMD